MDPTRCRHRLRRFRRRFAGARWLTLGNTDCDRNLNCQNVELGTISMNSIRGRLRSWLISGQKQLDEDMFLGKRIGLKVLFEK